MEGLEITEVLLLEHLKNNKFGRIDSEFRTKVAMSAESKLLARGAKRLSELAPSILHPKEIKREYLPENSLGGVWFFRAQNIRPLAINRNNQVFISDDDAATLKGNEIDYGDILITRTGANAGDCGQYRLDVNTIGSSHTFILRQERINQAYLSVFLNTLPVKSLIFASRYGGSQPEIAPYYLNQIPILIPSKKFQERIGELLHKSEKLEGKSKPLQIQAEQTLLSALDLEDWQPPNPLTYTANASEAFAATRLDAEYYHPEKHKMVKHLNNLGAKPLSQHVISVKKLLNPKKDERAFDVINYDLSDALVHTLDPDKDTDISSELGSTKKYIESGDLVVSRLRYYLKEVAVVPNSDRAIPRVGSTEFIVLRPKDSSISAATLCVYLRSQAAQSYFKWCRDGSMHPRFAENDLLDFPVPDKLVSLSSSIDNSFAESEAARQQSKSLLERAKRAVEIAIEQDEKTALAYLDGKHFIAGEILPKLFTPGQHYIDKKSIDARLEAEGLDYKPETIRRYLTEWTAQGLIHDAGRGWYSDLPDRFTPVTSVLDPLETLLEEHFPLLEWTAWSTRQLAPFFHHLPARHATFLMVERDAIETVATTLSDAGLTVSAHPLADAAKNFQLESDETIVIRPKLAEHSERHPCIEQILVDLHAECHKLALFDTSELERVKTNLANRYRIDISSVKNLAKRRKINDFTILNR